MGSGSPAARPRRGAHLPEPGLPWRRPRSVSVRRGSLCGAARAWGPGKEAAAAGPVGAGPGAGLIGSGRAGARSQRAGPVSAAPCRRAGRAKRGAREGRAAAAPPSRPRRRWPGLRGALGAGLSERGRGGRRPRAAAAARGPGTGSAGEAVSASPGRSGGETSSSCSGCWCTSLSFSLAHSLTSWLEIPTDVEREDRQTDTRAHAAGAGGGVAAGGGGSPRFWGRTAPGVGTRRPALLRPLGAALGRRMRSARSAAATPGSPAQLPLPGRRARCPGAAADGSSWGAGGAVAVAVGVGGLEPGRTGPGIRRG